MTIVKALLDFVPLILFFYLYKTTDPNNTNHALLQIFGVAGNGNNHILAATVGLILSMLVVYGYLFIAQKFHLHKQQWFVLMMTVVFGGITLALSDDYYIRLKAILINLGFAIALLLSPLFLKNKEPAIKKLFEPVFDLSTNAWQKLNYAWVALFLLMAGLHGFFAFVFADGKYWGEFTAFGDMIVMLVFIIMMMVVLRKHLKLSDNTQSS